MTTITFGEQSEFCTKFLTPEALEGETYSMLKPWFKGEYLETMILPDKEGAVLYVGCGEEKVEDVTIAMELAAKACRSWKNKKVTEFTLELTQWEGEEQENLLRAMAESCHLALQEAKNYKSEQKEGESYHIIFAGIDREQTKALENALEAGATLAKAVWFARDLVNMPANYLRPMDFAKKLIDFTKEAGVEAELFDFERLKAEGFGGIVGVGEGSEYPPCMLVLRYMPDKDSTEITGLVGKGVTVDTGGYCIKSAGSQGGIRGDMAGAAAVAGAIYSLARMKAKRNVVVVIPMCENKISGNSLLVGDVLTSYSGRTIEVGNTDAEGRLILADAVSYVVRKEKVNRVLDVATLTGAVASMFGNLTTGVLCDNDGMWEEFQQAAGGTWEKYWRLPFYPKHEQMIDSEVADIRNVGGNCGTITAGLFVRRFADETPWIHLDIAGTAWAGDPIYTFHDKLATGVGIDTMYQWLK